MSPALESILGGPGTPIAILVALDAHDSDQESRQVTFDDEFDEHRLLTVEKAAEYLSVGRDAVYQQIDAGRLQSLKIGGSRRITRQALVDFVKAGLDDTVTGLE